MAWTKYVIVNQWVEMVKILAGRCRTPNAHCRTIVDTAGLRQTVFCATAGHLPHKAGHLRTAPDSTSTSERAAFSINNIMI
jgi:hypothetical protein